MEIVILGISRAQQSTENFPFNLSVKLLPQKVSSLFSTQVVFFVH